MEKYKYIFVILTYRNFEDLEDCLKSIEKSVESYKVIIVDSFYSDQVSNEIKRIGEQFKADVFGVPNKGYGYGNNRGIEYANSRYKYDFLIVSNPDIIVKQFDDSLLDDFIDKSAVFAPLIKTATGKQQNPYWAVKNRFAEYLIYRGYKKCNNYLRYMGFGINKVIRTCFLKSFLSSKRNIKKIFAVHGAFLIFTDRAIQELGNPYDEKMFLFAEESLLAHVLEQKNIKSYLLKNIKIYHKEDGSMRIAKIDEKSEARKSVIYYYEKLYNK